MFAYIFDRTNISKEIKQVGFGYDNIVYTYDKENIQYYDLNGRNKEFNLGKLYIKDVYYRGYIKNDGDYRLLTLYDLKNNELASVYCKIITLCDKYLITDNSIYKIEIKEN